ncbi:protein of unknown function [Methylocaldum szegediense]|uniref:Uncharacterized protein n=1 Tax=Methylocaldum szegediense TaxID=73780 RepID=A0ABM9I2I1_9GAMM|nr:protein of unknown function [Methylocaldum szegediense]
MAALDIPCPSRRARIIRRNRVKSVVTYVQKAIDMVSILPQPRVRKSHLRPFVTEQLGRRRSR